MLLLKSTIILLFFENSLCFGFPNGFSHLVKKFQDVKEGSCGTETKWITQPVDHFDGSSKGTWQMRYFTNYNSFKSGGPIILIVGGEGEAHPSVLCSGLPRSLALVMHGALIASEHRYYGQSIPVPGSGAEAFKYLSAKEALADLALLIKTIKAEQRFQSSKVIVIGGSYPGNLAAWLRLLYPDLVDASVASSAPVLAKTNFYEYLETVSDDFEKYGSPGCLNNIRKIFNGYENDFKSKEGIAKLKKEYNICEECDMSIKGNQQYFFATKIIKFMDAAQTGIYDIERICSEIGNATFKNIYKDTNSIESKLLNNTKLCHTYDFKEYVLARIKDPWTYQLCTEFGYFQTTSSDRQPFTKSVPIDYSYNTCLGYGPQYDGKEIERGVEKTNLLFGGLNPKLSKVIFTNGELDPWHRLSILKSVGRDVPVFWYPGTTHCADLLNIDVFSPKEIVMARRRIIELLKCWTNNGPCYERDIE